jgi:hypothetical protein
MFETRQMMVEKMMTGRRPKDVWIGTLEERSTLGKG